MENTEHNEHKSAKKRLRWWYIPLSLILGLLLCVVAGWFYFTATPQGKAYLTFLGNKLVNEHLAYKADIGDLEFQFPPRVLLSNVVIYDHKDSVLFKAEAVRITPVWPPLQDSILQIDQVVLSHFNANLKMYQGDSNYNYAYAFKTSKGSKNKSPIESIRIRKLIFEEGGFNHFDYTRLPFRKKDEAGIDFYRLQTTGITGVLDSILIGKGVRAHLNNFGFREKSGFWVKSMTSDLAIEKSTFNWQNLELKSNKGKINGDILFSFNDWKSWKYFNDSVNISAALNQTELYFSDIGYFAPQVEKIANNISVDGKVSGCLNHFVTRQLKIKMGNKSFLIGEGELKNITDPKNAYLDFEVDRSELYIADVNQQIRGFNFPAAFYRLGDISLTGTFKGFVDSFKTIGTLKSALGLANANAAVKLDSVAANNKYSGHLNLVNFNLGEFLENNDFGIVSIDSDIEAKGNKIENLSAQIDAKVTSFTYKRYNYHNVKIDGKLANYFFKGELNSKDTNANIKLLGTVNFTNKIPKIDIDARLHQLNLHKLNLTKDTISIKSKVLANFEGNKVENFIGSVSTQNLFLTVNQNKYETGFTTLNGSLTPMGKSWTLESDFATASIETSIPLTQIPQSLIEHGILLVPKNIGQQTQLAPHYLNATASIHNPLILNSIIPDNLLFAQNTKAAVFIDDSEQIFDIEFSAPFFKYDNIYFDAPQTTICSNADTLFAFGKLLALNTNEFSLNGFNFNLSSDSSFVYLNHSGSINDSIVNFNLNHSIAYSQTGNTAITIDSSQFTVDTNTFKIACDTLLWQQLTDFKFDNLAFYLGNEKLLTNGTASLKNEYNVDYSLFRLSLSKVAPFLPDYFKTITGQVSGNGHINSDKGHPVIEASLYANPVSFNNLDIDAIQIESHYSAQTKVLAIYSSILNPQGKEILYVKGGLNYLTQPTIDLLFGADAIPNSFFEPLTIDVVSDLKGSATASARLSGPLESPKLNGWLALDSSFLHVDYLGTNYSLEDTFFINSEKILVNNLTLIDHRGKTAIVNGNIKHDLLKKFDLNLDLRCTDFTVFDIDENENDLYYGSFYGTGSAKFTGPMLRANIYCDLVTEKGTKFFLPIEEEQGYSQESFIRFVNSENALTEYEVNDQDFSLDLNVTLNPKAETQLIFDKKLGDIIKASGDGKLNMKLTPAGEFQMFGDYIIDQGNYLFTAFDLINKRFEIEKGGKISWVGDPYDALIDIKANYNLKANAYSLASNLPQYDAAQLEQYKTPVPVVAYAQLNGSLLKPEINLDFEFIDEGGVDVASLQRELDNMNFSDEELTKQVVSLLVLNRFMPMYNSAPVNTDIFSSSVNAGLGDLISNQLTYWLSAISDDLQVNVNYRRYTSDGIELSEGELELALSTTFFNDRVGVDFAYELQNGYSPNKEISYKVNPDGSIKVLVFQRQTQNPVITFNSNTYGFGVFLKREFESVKDLFKKKKNPINE